MPLGNIIVSGKGIEKRDKENRMTRETGSVFLCQNLVFTDL